MLDSCKMVEKQSEAFHTFLWHFFPSLKQNFIAYRSSKVPWRPDCIFEIQQLWQSGFSRVYSNSFCSCWFGPEIIKISQSSHRMYNNNILNFQESTTILNACTKKSRNLLNAPRNFCIDEKISIINFKNRRLLLNERNELVFKCKGKFKLSWLGTTEAPVLDKIRDIHFGWVLLEIITFISVITKIIWRGDLCR